MATVGECGDLVSSILRYLLRRGDLLRCSAVCRLWYSCCDSLLPELPRDTHLIALDARSRLWTLNLVTLEQQHHSAASLPFRPSRILAACRGLVLIQGELGSSLRLAVGDPFLATWRMLPPTPDADFDVVNAALVADERLLGEKITLVLLGHRFVYRYNLRSHQWHVQGYPVSIPDLRIIPVVKLTYLAGGLLQSFRLDEDSDRDPPRSFWLSLKWPRWVDFDMQLTDVENAHRLALMHWRGVPVCMHTSGREIGRVFELVFRGDGTLAAALEAAVQANPQDPYEEIVVSKFRMAARELAEAAVEIRAELSGTLTDVVGGDEEVVLVSLARWKVVRLSFKDMSVVKFELGFVNLDRASDIRCYVPDRGEAVEWFGVE